MNKLIIILGVLGIIFLHSCTKDKELGKIEPLADDYVLPQGKSPADDRIVKLYEQYGSYFLYEFSRRDFDWKLINTSLGEYGEVYSTYSYTPADPAFVGDMLDLLDTIWFCFYPEKFLKETIPYRILMVSSLEETALWWDETEEKMMRLDENQIVLSYCSDILLQMSAERKLTYKNKLQLNLFYYWLERGMFEIPEAFYEVSEYWYNTEILILKTMRVAGDLLQLGIRRKRSGTSGVPI